MDTKLMRELLGVLVLIQAQTRLAIRMGTPSLVIEAYLANLREMALQNPRFQRRTF